VDKSFENKLEERGGEMTYDPIIPSVLDTDMYKLTMGQGMFRRHDRVGAGHIFINRDPQRPFPDDFASKLRQQVEYMADLALTVDEGNFLDARCGHYLRAGFLDWLFHYRFDPHEVVIEQNGSHLSITTEGRLYRTTYWEVPLLALVSELYGKEMGLIPDPYYVLRAQDKGKAFKEAGARVAEFGTRRRFSREVQERVLRALLESAGSSLMGTSNLRLAMKYNLTPIGTHAHEWFQLHAGMYGFRSATREALRNWSDEYEGSLGTALTDTFTTAVFLREFGTYYAKLFDGVRQDSGDPFEFTNRMVTHYRSFGVNPLSKWIVFSDSLNTERVLTLIEHCRNRIQCIFGIGTNLTNDVGHAPLNIVMKLAYIVRSQEAERHIPVCKLSDDPGKESGPREAVEAARYELGLV